MTKTNTQFQPRDVDEAIRQRILERVRTINTKLLTRLGTVEDDLQAGGHLAALGGLDGIEQQLDTMRSLLLLFP